jgi:chloride channel protein, CIC family
MQGSINYFKRFSFAENKQILIYALCVGLLAGTVAICFEVLLHFAQGYLFTEIGNREVVHPFGETHRGLKHFQTEPGGDYSWYFIILPCIGGLITGWIIYKFSPESAGTGTDAMIDAFHNKVGKINANVPFLKGLTTIITLASGGSTGKEGPVAQIGAGIGSFFATKLGIGVRARRTLLLAGTAAGLGAIFQAPIGAAITAVEVLYHEDIESDALIPCVISSITAYALFGSVFGFSHIFYLPNATSIGFDLNELMIFIAMGVICCVVGFIYVKVFFGMRDYFFAKINVPAYVKPAIGGLMVGIIGFMLPEILSSGFGYIQIVIETGYADVSWNLVVWFFIIAMAKIFATSCTVSSGGSGGVFAPSLFIGAMIGAAFGAMAYLLFPEKISSPFGAFVLIGMSSFFAGVARAPIAAVIMISEMTGGYQLIAPLMFISVLVIIFSQQWSIYENQVKNKFHSKAHVGDMTIDVLQEIKVESLGSYRQVGVISSHTLFTAGEAFGQKIHASDLVLIDHDDVFAGMVSLRDVHFDSTDEFIASLITLEDIMTPNVPFLYPDNNLHEALEILMSSEFDKVPVIRRDNDTEGHLLGYLLYSDILEKYHDIVKPKNTFT